MPPKGSPRSFALTGPSPHIDPRVQAVRADLADVRLADHVFAPHYAAPVTMKVVTPTVLRELPSADAAMLASLTTGETFEMLDVASGFAWGIAVAHRLVGYVARDALAPSDGSQ